MAAAVLSVTAAGLLPASASAAHAPESIFQDDDHLVYASTATVTQTLDTLAALGVDRIRVTVQWNAIAPDPSSTTEPAGFDATDPNAYTLSQYGGSANVWDAYDRVVEMAAARGIGVDFNVSAPGPLWAMQSAPVTAAYGTRPANHYEPSATEFGQFVQAVGTRYSGTYVPPSTTTTTPAPPPITLPILGPPTTTTTTTTTSAGTGPPLPRVDYWSIWNEPDQPGWLAPQWKTVGGRRVPASPGLYRSLVDAAVGALDVTGHTLSSDTILVGETAPEGAVTVVGKGRHVRYLNATGFYEAMPAMVFVRALYCVNASYRRLTGTAASAIGCPTSGSAHAFVTQHPGLFYATGFAHHPYFFLYSPSYSSPVPTFVPLANLGRLERGLNRTFASYGVHRSIPIYFTEYGYQTKPPDPYQVVSPAKQAIYLNEADYMAWKDPRVKSVSQFLLYDAGPNPLFAPSAFDYWDTFQTGLIYGPGTSRDGQIKPAYYAYRLPIWIPTARIRRGAKTLVWGMLRLAPKNTAERAAIQWKPARRGQYKTIATVSVPASAVYGYFTTRVKPPGTGTLRIAWRSAAGHTYTSRAAAVTVGLSRSSSSALNGSTPLH
ncbi:MAG TPA: hypothetical protein VG186_17785 [Solirubrobacteraceae bacterium]|nr:hypothetical protein [Solirubrobacteraceae bacterium]